MRRGDTMTFHTRANKYLALICLTILLIPHLACAGSPEDGLRNFFSNQGSEETLMDPLILAGDEVVPLILERIKDKNMPRRRYAIGFLGNGSYKQAIPILENILKDATEKDYFRGDALQSIYQADEVTGLRLAQIYQGAPGHLGKVATDLVTTRNHLPPRRSYLDAFFARHK